MKNRLMIGTLVMVAGFLLLNLVKGGVTLSPPVEAQVPQGQMIGFDADVENGAACAITCSSDGRYVYAVDAGKIFRSTKNGARGSWEIVAH